MCDWLWLYHTTCLQASTHLLCDCFLSHLLYIYLLLYYLIFNINIVYIEWKPQISVHFSPYYSYRTKHGCQAVLQTVIKEKPENPYDYMARCRPKNNGFDATGWALDVCSNLLFPNKKLWTLYELFFGKKEWTLKEFWRIGSVQMTHSDFKIGRTGHSPSS